MRWRAVACGGVRWRAVACGGVRWRMEPTFLVISRYETSKEWDSDAVEEAWEQPLFQVLSNFPFSACIEK